VAPSYPPRIARLSLAAAVAALAAACSPLSLFAAFAPQDPGARSVTGLAYGPAPRQKLDVYLPPGAPKGAPVAVFFYGGAWDSGRRQDYSWVGRALAARGFVTLVADYRLYPQARFPVFLEDGAKALRWARDHAADYGGDPARLVMVGHSAGAYNAVMLALDSRYVRAEGLEPRSIRAVAGLSGPYDFLPLDGAITTRTFGQAADLEATQPARFVRPGAPPAFLATGGRDRTVYPRNTVVLAKARRAAGVTVEEHVYPEVDHPGTILALSRTFRGKTPVLDEMTAFLLAHSR
jgi:acetyl esterase/lipase